MINRNDKTQKNDKTGISGLSFCLLYLVMMNYYDETLIKIRNLIDQKEFDEAKRLISNELEMAYIPKDFENELRGMIDEINDSTISSAMMGIEQIESYLQMDEQHQLLAVDALNKMNLRDHIGLCERYLSSDAFINGKVLLIDSLIAQQIDHGFIFQKDQTEYSFNPARCIRAEDSDTFKKCSHLLEERFMKEPSMLIMAKQLLFKELMFSLPFLPDVKNAETISEKIIAYILDAFDQVPDPGKC